MADADWSVHLSERDRGDMRVVVKGGGALWILVSKICEEIWGYKKLSSGENIWGPGLRALR